MVLKRSTVPPISGKLNSTEQTRYKVNQLDTKEDEATCAKRSKIAQRVPLKRGKKMARKKDDAGKNGGSECGTNFNLCQE